MMTIVQKKPTTHALYDRDDGLAHCKVCNGAESSLPTDCPGVRMSENQELNVQDQRIDFVDGKWVLK